MDIIWHLPVALLRHFDITGSQEKISGVAKRRDGSKEDKHEP